MPGSPDPVLGSLAATAGVSVAVAGVIAAIPLAFRDDLPPPRRLVVGGGLAYALLCLGVWAGARTATDAFVSSLVEDPTRLAVLLVVSAVVLGAQAAVPLYLNARWGLATPLVGLFAATTLVLYAFLQVRGETDPLALYTLFFGPMVVGLVVAVALAEIGVRRAVATWG